MRWRARLAASATGALLLAVAVAPGAGAADPTDSILLYACDPPLPRSAANCAIWHTSPVTLRWTIVDSNFVPVPGSDCDTKVISQDTAGTNVTCAVWDPAQTQVQKTATMRVDQTAPTLTGATPDRPPDYDGWWNHPVSVAFAGTDATSGIASCDTVAYSGPDSAGTQVTGACRDVAGNSASGTFPIKYDATPPAITAMSPDVGDKRVTLNWSTTPDAVATRVVRSPGIGGAPVSEVYSGSDRSFADPGVTNGTNYTYTITTSDPAGNSASAVTAATPKAAVRPLRSPRLRWRKVKGADYYNVQVYRGKRKILSAWPRGNDLRLKRSWTFRGRRHVLTAGKYDWYAWPGYGPRSAHRYGKLITHRRFSLKLG